MIRTENAHRQLISALARTRRRMLLPVQRAWLQVARHEELGCVTERALLAGLHWFAENGIDDNPCDGYLVPLRSDLETNGAY